MTKFLSLLAAGLFLVGCTASPEAPTTEPDTTVEVNVEAEAETAEPAPTPEIPEDTEATGDVTFEAALQELDLLEQ